MSGVYLNNGTLVAKVNKQREQTDMKSCYNLSWFLRAVETHYVPPWQHRENVTQTLKTRTSTVEYHLHTQLLTT